MDQGSQLKYDTLKLKNMKKVILIFLTLILLFCGIDRVFSQEWEVVYYSDPDVSRCSYNEAIELSNGNILVASVNQPRNNNDDNTQFFFYYSRQSLLSLISPDGNEIYRNEYDYFKPGLCITTNPYLFEKNGEIYFLTSYSPDHDIYSKNYFKNQDSVPTESIIGLYKLNEMLNIAESYEHVYPIDTFERKDEFWYTGPNIYSGYIYIYSAFEDDGHITGSYIKNESRRYVGYDDYNDSVFFFKMDFDGNFLIRKGYEIDTACGYGPGSCHRQQMIKNDNGYTVYYRGCPLYGHGTVEYYDNEFNYVTSRLIEMPGLDTWYDYGLDHHSVMRSKHNTTYVSTASSRHDIYWGYNDIRLYEFDDDLNNSTEILPVLNYIERGVPDHDRPALLPMDMTKNGDIYFTYTLNCGFWDNQDSWIVIERLNSDFDTISTFFYDEVGTYNRATCITTTKDDGLLLVSYSYDLIDKNIRWSKVTKFPASAFVTIEEAHAHNLKVAVAYPNPGGDVMNIRTSLRDCTLQVYDMQGRLVHQQDITDDVTSIDASNWTNGTYVWELGTGNGNGILESGKWVK